MASACNYITSTCNYMLTIFQVRHIICAKGKKHPLMIMSVTLDHVSVACTTSAADDIIPPFLIYKKSLPVDGFDDGLPDNWVYAYNESGHMTGELMVEWLCLCFIPNIGQEHPVLLILDNHQSHLIPDVIDCAIQTQIELYCEPANTAHLLQPNDQLYHGLKSAMGELAAECGYLQEVYNLYLIIRCACSG